jgi:hypothetical protein
MYDVSQNVPAHRREATAMLTMIALSLSLSSAACVEAADTEMAAEAQPSSDETATLPGAEKAACGVRNGRLYCGNRAPVAVRESKTGDARPLNWLRTTYSWFECFSWGDTHHGGNHTWYFTQGDDNRNWGWVAAGDVFTSSEFDQHPGQFGLDECGL